MPVFIDQLGRSVELKKAPQRIVSAVPSLSELIVDLGAEERLVGITSWCVHPPNLLLDKKVIGGTKNLDIAKIRSLKPDLIIANKEENPQEQIEALAKEFPVWVSDVRSIDQAFEMITELGTVLHLKRNSEELIKALGKLRETLPNSAGLTYLYFIWKDPYMVASEDTYISALFQEIGMLNLAPVNEERYPILSIKDIQSLNPDRIILSSEPFAFKAIDLKLFHDIGLRSFLVNGELFTWYGSRIKASLEYLKKIHLLFEAKENASFFLPYRKYLPILTQNASPILFYSGNFTCKKMVELALADQGYQLMSTANLQDLPDLKALSYFHLLIFCPGPKLEEELQYLQEVKRFYPAYNLPLILLDSKQLLEDYDDLDQMDLQEYRCLDLNKKSIRFSVKRLLENRQQNLERDAELNRLKLEAHQKTDLLEEVSLKAQESERLKTAFLNNISHELRTPMNGILGFLEYLEDPQLEGEIKSRFIKNIRDSSDRLLNTLQDLIEISEIEAGDLKVKFQTVNLRKVLAFIEKLFAPRAQAKGLEFKAILDIEEEKQIIWSDENKIKGILIHLLNNALKFTNTGNISLSIKALNDEIFFQVQDTGIGMDESDIAHIYEHFVQIEEHLTRKYDGLGLGLSICEAYSRCLSGELGIDSQIDIGTTVGLRLPFISGKKEVDRNQQDTSAQNKFKQAKVLLVDDDPINLQLLEKFLVDRVADLSIVKAKNGVEAVQFYRQNADFDLILMDLKMPMMNGFEATKQIREINEKVPIIAQTAYAMHQDKEKALSEGCNDYLSKPLNKTLFYNTLEKYLNR